MHAVIEPRGAPWQRTGTLVGVGLLGVVALVLQPLPQAALTAQPELAALPWWALKLLALVNPTVLLVVAALVGVLVAHRVGLRSLLAGTAQPGERTQGWWLAAVAGLATGALIVGLDMLLAPWLGGPWQAFLSQASHADASALLMGVLYGGITEEILMRWGLMSALAWALWSLGGQRHLGASLVLAALVTAVVFGLAHLPVLQAQLELSAGMVWRTVCLNGLAALVYAWVFWRHHLEAAMLSHACSHLAMGALWALT